MIIERASDRILTTITTFHFIFEVYFQKILS
jgi:hypothetical protein